MGAEADNSGQGLAYVSILFARGVSVKPAFSQLIVVFMCIMVYLFRILKYTFGEVLLKRLFVDPVVLVWLAVAPSSYETFRQKTTKEINRDSILHQAFQKKPMKIMKILRSLKYDAMATAT